MTALSANFDGRLRVIRAVPRHYGAGRYLDIEAIEGEEFLIDFNYDTEPLPGKFPLPGIGPFSLLEETKANHYGKMMFRWVYWNLLLRGAELPIEAEMSMAGKRR